MKKEPVVCDVCGCQVESGIVYPVNFEHMLGLAGWHMTFEPRMNLCHECSRNLLAYVERWFKFCDKTHKYKKKYVR